MALYFGWLHVAEGCTNRPGELIRLNAELGEIAMNVQPSFPTDPDSSDLLHNLNTYEIRDPSGKLLTTVQGNDPRSVLGIMMLVWGEGIRVVQVGNSQ